MVEISIENQVYVSVEVIVAFLSVFGNILVCYVVLKTERLRKKPMYMILISLALADVTVGSLGIPFSILAKLGLPHNAPSTCIALLTFIVIVTQISIFNLTIVSVERYIAICHPREHFNKLTSQRTLQIVVITWILSIFLGIPPLGWNNLDQALESHAESISYGNDTEKPFQCLFIEVMNYDFMFFNFMSCVIPPLLVCAASYFFIFRSLMEIKRPPISPVTCTSSYFSSSLPTPNHATVTKKRLNYEAFRQGDVRNERVQVIQTICDSQAPAHETFPEATSEEPIPASADQFSTRISWLTSLRRVRENKKENHTNKKTYRNDSVIIEEISSELPSEYNKQPKDNRKGALTLRTPQAKAKRMKKKREAQAAVVLGILVLMFAICLIPIHILNAIYRFSSPGSVSIPSWIFSVAIVSSHANSAVNVFLYSWRLKAFRKALNRNVLRKLCYR